IGSQLFGDRDFTFRRLQDSLVGAEQITTACDSKNFTGSKLASFIPVGDITVSVAFDNRIENIPAWLADWTKTDLQVTSSNDVIFNIYQKKFSGSDDAKITLGATEQSAYCVNYAVFLQESSQKIMGDANADGEVTVADAVVLQKWLLCHGGLPNWENVDLHKDGKINIFDLCLLKKLLIENK
ncbi:MAG: dockerin type I repeat-containing protein, partial [Oscillospiraceae bacterium]|nr:dockerin type I repeat-containing protein [Oscillospiraceae bacterium]